MASMELFDYVIIGAGSAGCVIANRLVGSTGARVLLLEAGGPDTLAAIHQEEVASTMSLWGQAGLDWGYVTEPQAGLGGRCIPVARGKVWGGSSSINAMLHVRGNRRDFDHWSELGNEGWSYEEVLPCFKRSEDFAGGDARYRGAGGPLPVITHDRPTPVSECLFAAASGLGFTDRGRGFDYNGKLQEGSPFYYQATKTRRHTRASTAVCFLEPLLGQPGFTLRSHAQVTRLLLRGTRVVGVEYLQGGQVIQVAAEQEVILCAGTYESPKLLMLSGIGPAQALAAHGLEAVVDLPGVGQDLQDHMILGVCYQSRQEPPHAPTLIAETGLFTRTRARPAQEPPDLQLKLGGLKFVSARYAREGPGFTLAPVLIQPESRGHVALRSRDPLQPARVQPHYLRSAADMRVLLEGIELSRELVHTSAFADFRGEELAPGGGARSEAALREYIRDNASTLWHPVGTCRMGRDAMAVVDPQLRVHGVLGLRIADASVMPRIVSGNTNAACLMIGERAADLLKPAGSRPRPRTQPWAANHDQPGSGLQPGESLMSNAQEGILLHRRFFEAFNRRDYGVLDEVMAQDFVDHHPGLVEVSSLEVYKRNLAHITQALDMRASLEEIAEVGDRLYTRVRLTGRHLGRFFGMEPTGKELLWYTQEQWRFQAGRLLERWAVDDLASLYAQMGAPMPSWG